MCPSTRSPPTFAAADIPTNAACSSSISQSSTSSTRWTSSASRSSSRTVSSVIATTALLGSVIEHFGAVDENLC
jgi:hypothetical protein